MIYIFFAIWLTVGASAFLAHNRRTVHRLCALYLTSHALFAGLLFGGNYLTTSGAFFTFDELGTLFYTLLAVVAVAMLVTQLIFGEIPWLRLFRHTFDVIGTENLHLGGRL